jgi:protein O-mannosyl-transferase
MRRLILICLALALVMLAAYWPVLQNDFVNYDDNEYVTENIHVLHGLNWPDAKWAFTTGQTGSFVPLTWLSHQLDYQLYDGSAGGHHLTNLVLHIVNALLLFLLIWRMTRAMWPSIFVAAVFAIHPLHVESVAWISERKDVLSGLFFMLTLHAYVTYAAKPRLLPYTLALLLFILGLLSKPMLVTLPCVLLLLDYWPLQRMSFGSEPEAKRTFHRLVLEKIPFAMMAGVWSILTFIIQRKVGAVADTAKVGIGLRIENTLTSYAAYLWKTFWPQDLAVFYPYPSALPWRIVALSTALLVLVSGLCLARRKSSPYLFVGWLWYLGMLVPVIGLLQAGAQARADRYTYLPQIGLCLALGWGMAELTKSWPYRRYVLAATALIALAMLMGRTWDQTKIWRDSESLWTHAVAVTSNNDTAHNNLGIVLSRKGDVDQALLHFEKVREIKPNRRKLNYNMAVALVQKGKIDDAIANYQRELEIQPEFAEAHNNLGILLAQKGRTDEAIAHLQKALEIEPRYPKLHYNLAHVLLQKGQIDDAIIHYQKELQLQPNETEALNDLGIAFSQKGRVNDAIVQWQKTLEIQPDNLNAQSNLAWIFATHPDRSIRDGAKAITHATRALQLSNERDPRIFRLLAAAYAENARFDDAITAAERGLELASARGDSALAATLKENIALYRTKVPLRDTSISNR